MNDYMKIHLNFSEISVLHFMIKTFYIERILIFNGH